MNFVPRHDRLYVGVCAPCCKNRPISWDVRKQVTSASDLLQSFPIDSVKEKIFSSSKYWSQRRWNINHKTLIATMNNFPLLSQVTFTLQICWPWKNLIMTTLKSTSFQLGEKHQNHWLTRPKFWSRPVLQGTTTLGTLFLILQLLLALALSRRGDSYCQAATGD